MSSTPCIYLQSCVIGASSENPLAFNKLGDQAPVMVSSDEDTGEVIQRNRSMSPDPIDSISDDDVPSARRATSASRTPSRMPLAFVPEPRARRVLPSDGESTRRLAHRLQTGSQSQVEIINIDDDDLPAPPASTLEEDFASEHTSVETTDSASHSHPSSSSTNTRHTSPTVRYDFVSRFERNPIVTSSLLRYHNETWYRKG